MNAAYCFFRVCRQRQLQNSLSNIRQAARGSTQPQTSNFVSFSRHYAQPTEGVRLTEPATEQPLSTDQSRSLFCGGLAFGVEKETVLQAFSKHGTVTGIRLARTKTNGSNNGWGGYTGGFCFLEFASHEEARATLEAMNKTEFAGKTIELAYEKPPAVRPKGQITSSQQLLKPSSQSRMAFSERDREYIRTQPLVTGTVSRTGTMLKTVAVTTNHRQLDNDTKTHHVEQDTVLVHDPECILVEGDVIKYQHFPPDLYAGRAARGKTNVKYILKEVVTPFGLPLEERTPYVAAEAVPKKSRKGVGSKNKAIATATADSQTSGS